MSVTIEQDRPAHLLLASDPNLTLVEARQRLNQAALAISADEAIKTSWGQAALLTIVECAVRMFRGGVYLVGKFGEPVIVGNWAPMPLRRMLAEAGCRTDAAPDHALHLYIGSGVGGDHPRLRCWADGWTATVSPNPATKPVVTGNELSGALAGALSVSEAFRIVVLNDLRAGRWAQRLSPFVSAGSCLESVALKSLPSWCWILGLGNLGQALVWVFGLLPYADPSKVTLLLQDCDTSEKENLYIQVLTKPDWIGRKKTRNVAQWIELLGFRTIVTERPFTASTCRTQHEPGLAFVGVDNLLTRRDAARSGANFDLLIDAGLGGTSGEVFDIRIHAFPGSRDAQKAWPSTVPKTETALPPWLTRLVEEGRVDQCGALTIAGQSVGVPSTAIVAATIQVAQACRAISSSKYCDLVDISLVDTRRMTSNETTLKRAGVIPFAPAR